MGWWMSDDVSLFIVLLLGIIVALFAWAIRLRDERNYYRLRCAILIRGIETQEDVGLALHYQQVPDGVGEKAPSGGVSHPKIPPKVTTEAKEMVQKWKEIRALKHYCP